jgi:glycosyltransferase involved in cell wall biosynthesis
MKILHISYSDLRGGASIAAFEIHKSLLSLGLNSSMLVQKKFSDCDLVYSTKSLLENIIADVKISINRKIVNFLKTDNKTSYSLALFSSTIIKKIKEINPDIIHLHWINNEILSLKGIYELGKNYKIIWTLHDMWPFCGSEHYTDSLRFILGYKSNNRPNHEKGLDINRWTWDRKVKYLGNKIHFISPSKWMFLQIRKSFLFKNNESYQISYPINHKIWFPFEKLYSRNFLSIPLDTNVVLFGSERGNGIERKGFSILYESLSKIDLKKMTRIIVFGGKAENEIRRINENLEIQFVGHIYDKLLLRVYYSASDICALPSTQEAFGLICAEASACCLPCIAFNNTGHSDIILHKKSGYLADYKDIFDFKNGLEWLLDDDKRLKEIGINARKNIIKNFDNQKIAIEHKKVYENLLKNN